MKLIRFSGRPVDEEHLKAFEEHFKVGFDAAMRKHAAPGQEAVEDTLQLKAVDMLSVQADLQQLEDSLLKQYAAVADTDLPKTLKGWKALLSKVGAPIMIAQSSDNPKELVLVIVDTSLQG